MTEGIRGARKSRAVLWLAAPVALAILLAALALAIRAHPSSSPDETVISWVQGSRAPGLDGFFDAVSLLTGKRLKVVVGVAGVLFLWFIGSRRPAAAFAVASLAVGLAMFSADYALGEVTGRGQPVAEITRPSFPSGHVSGTTAFLGFIAFIAVRHRLRSGLLIPTLTAFVVATVLVGVARIFVQAHWPSDVAGGYLLGLLALLAFVRLYSLIEMGLYPALSLSVRRHGTAALALISRVL